MAHQINLYKNGTIFKSQKGAELIMEFTHINSEILKYNPAIDDYGFYFSKELLEKLYCFLDFDNFTELRDAYNCGRLIVFLEENLFNFNFNKDILSIGWCH